LPPKKNLKSSFLLRFKARRAEGGVWGIPPAEPEEFRSDIFKQTPPFDFAHGVLPERGFFKEEQE